MLLLRRSCAVCALLVLAAGVSYGQGPARTTPYIMIDQFGYPTGAEKVAVLVDPVHGFNGEDAYDPASQMQVRRWSDDAVVFEGGLGVWNSGNVQANSGDRGWWFDFSEVTEEGSYYLYDPENEVGSGRFEIRDDVYYDVLRAAARTYFYQRVNHPKRVPFADPRWADEAAFEGPDQDRAARFVDAKGDPSTERDLHGGWLDAGDYNKYVTFATQAVHGLLTTYGQYPALWQGMDLNIPESLNDVPDLLDEVKWELDWILRMQDTDGGLFIKMGNIDHNEVSPPSKDRRPRYYEIKCSSSAIEAAGMFAHGALVYQTVPTLESYADTLAAAAEAAWDWYQTNPRSEACDDTEIKAGDADRPFSEQDENEVVAAVYLYALTGEAAYHDVVKDNYRITRPWDVAQWGYYFTYQGDAMHYYAALPEADPAVAGAILARKRKAGTDSPAFKWDRTDDLYRAYLPVYTWGSNQVRANMGHIIYDMITYDLNPERHETYRRRAAGALHYLHGVNPFSMVYLSNMYDHGAERSVNEIYHNWFDEGTVWEDALEDVAGPAPGYLPGGPNDQYDGDHTIDGHLVRNQPLQKSYVDEGSGNRIWMLTEPAIYYNAAYIKLLAHFVPAQPLVRATGVVLSPDTLDLGLNDVGRLEAQVLPEGASNQTLVWASSDSSIAVVDAQGRVRPFGIGTTTVMASHALFGFGDEAVVRVGPPSELVLSATPAPEIDGVREDAWGDDAYVLENAALGNPSADDLAASWSARWDDDHLYLFVDVADEARVADSFFSPQEDDYVEVFLDVGNDKGDRYGATDFRYGFSWDGMRLRESSNNAVDGVEWAIGEGEGGYALEARIPWPTLGTAPAADAVLGIDVAVSDDDGEGLENILVWYGESLIVRTRPDRLGTTVLSTRLSVESEEEAGPLEATHRLTSPYPNPVRVRGAFHLEVREAQPVRVGVYDLLGRRVALLHDGPLGPGTPHTFYLEAGRLASGVYLIQAEGRTFTAQTRAVVVR